MTCVNGFLVQADVDRFATRDVRWCLPDRAADGATGRRHGLRFAAALAGAVAVACAGCAAPLPPGGSVIGLPLLAGWFDGEPVGYVTTDVSDADVAAAKGANFAPRLSAALPAAIAAGGVRPSALDKVYAVTNFEQGSVFASAPAPVGPASRDTSYTPLWQMVTVTWASGRTPRRLESQDQVLAAAERGEVTLAVTPVLLNCPIVHRGGRLLPGAALSGNATR